MTKLFYVFIFISQVSYCTESSYNGELLESPNHNYIIRINKIDSLKINRLTIDFIDTSVEDISNNSALPYFPDDNVFLTGVEFDSTGFIIKLESGQGWKLFKEYYFYRYKEDIVLHKIKEKRYSPDGFEQIEKTTNFVYKNVVKYDSIYSIYYFRYLDFY